MRVFCPQHKIGFFTPRRNPIRCENRGHVLGEFNFHGDANVPAETLWQYCCNCEHFCPIELEQSGLEACPACSRPISQRYICDHCFMVSVESTTPIQAKNFTLTSDGAPQPSCPGCFQEASADLREHECEKLGAHFMTALNACPICFEHLDVGPVFPSSVAQYLKKIKAANERNVSFDYATGLFVPLDNGEFVLLSSGSENSRPIVLPRSARFESKRHFYELYQDYYHCAKVDAGEVHIIEPAVVEPVRDGWKLQSMGVLQIVDDQAKVDAPVSDIPIRTEFPVRERSARFSASLTEEPPAATKEPNAVVIEQPPLGVACADCGALVETAYSFCWNCGHSTQPNGTANHANQTRAVSHRILADDDESIVQHDAAPVQPSIFSWALPQPSETLLTSSRLRFIAIVIGGFLLVILGGLLLYGPLSRLGRSADAQQITTNLQSGSAPKLEPTPVRAETKAQATSTIDTADQELRKLRERRLGAAPSDRLTILQLFSSTEQRYPNDYRFPYERAKLAIDERETRSHDDAFNALSLAAEAAIRADKTQEMLEGLESDKFGDFHKLSHGHREWTQIIEALKKRDVALLASN